MSTTDQAIAGGRELDDLLKTLPAKMQKNISRSALRAGASVIRREAQALAPVESGDLRKSIRITSRAKAGEVTVSVKAGNSTAYYASMVEFGTRPHLVQVDDRDRGINRRTGRQISVTTINRQRSLSIGGNLVGPSVSHPGSRPRPFMRPAADHAFAPAVTAITAKYRQRLTAQGLNVPETLPSDPQE